MILEALHCYKQMVLQGLPSNDVTLICILKACGCFGAVDEGERIHKEIISRRLLEKDIAIGSSLVEMYATCGVCFWANLLQRMFPYGQQFQLF